MAKKSEASKKASEENLKELLLKEEDKLKKVLLFMKSAIRESNLPWVSWKMLQDNAEKIVGSTRRPESDLWAIMQPFTYTLVEKEKDPKSENPEFYEYKIGNTWVYFPANMIALYCEKDD
jgi:hypothetical protein